MSLTYEYVWHVEEVDEIGHKHEKIALTNNVRIGIVAYEEACKQRPHRKIRLCNGSRIVKESWK